ncbi:hypothetical protein FKM82_005798, partial [Ascaphus truei]
MPGRPAPSISFNCVDNSLSSLKNCQAYINTGMEIATSVALDLLENGCDTTEVTSMETVMLEYATMDRDLNQYIHAVEDTVHKLKQDQPEQIPDIKGLVKESFVALQSKNTDVDLRKNDRFVNFKEQLRDMRQQ